MLVRALAVAAVASGLVVAGPGDDGRQAPSVSTVPLVVPARVTPAGAVGGCPVLPADDWWNTRVDRLPVDPRSATWLAHMGAGPGSTLDLHPDFGGPYGIPVTVVGRDHPLVPVRFGYADESDRVRYPLGADTRIEGGRASSGDRHAIVVRRGACRLYETYATRHTDRGWTAGSGAVWSLRSDRLRPDGWTSADAAGLPILPGLLRWGEVAAGHVDHAIRFTTDRTAAAHLWPARHDAGSGSARVLPPMGARFRLRASWHPRGFSPAALVVVRAMKEYGLVLADNGSPWFFTGAQSPRWPDRLIADLKRIPAGAFQAVDTSGLRVSPGSGGTR